MKVAINVGWLFITSLSDGVAMGKRVGGRKRGRGQRSERQTNTEMWSRMSSGKVGEVSPIDFSVTLFPGDLGSVYPRTNLSAVSVFSLCNSQGVIDDEEWPALGINRDNVKSGSMAAANNASSSPRFAAGDSKPSTTSRMPHDALLTSDVPLTTSDSLTNTNAHVSSRVAASDMSDAACDDPSPAAASTVTDQSSLCDNSKKRCN